MNTQHICTKDCLTKVSLHRLADTARFKANKYRHDPFLSELHGQYLEAINAVIEADGKEVANV